MKTGIHGTIIHDTKAQKYFGFIKEFPGVCAQGNTKEETINKINRNWSKFIDKMTKYKTYYKKYHSISGWNYCVL